MQTKKLGWTDIYLSTVGLGSWAIGGGDWAYGWGAQRDDESIATIHRALDMGVNWVDTAPVYGLGHSEEVVGRAIQEYSIRPIVSTKCGQVAEKDGKITSCIKASSIRREVEESLKRLKVEVIDLYQIHWPLPEDDIEEGWETLSRLIAEGKIRYAGVSNFNVDQLKRIQAIHPVAFLQPPYSMLKRECEAQLLAYCEANHIGVIVYSPLQKGLLTGKFDRERIKKLPENDHRRNDRHFQPSVLEANFQLIEGLRDMAQNCGRTVAQLAISWVLRRPEVTAAIVGGRHPGQIEETIKAGEQCISPEEEAAIEVLLQKRQDSMACSLR